MFTLFETNFSAKKLVRNTLFVVYDPEGTGKTQYDIYRFLGVHKHTLRSGYGSVIGNWRMFLRSTLDD